MRKRSEKEEKPQVAEHKGEPQTNIEPSKTLIQTTELVNRIREKTETVKQMDLDNISNKLDKLGELNMILKEIVEIKSEFARLSKYAKIFFGLGIAALLIYCINGVITLLIYFKPK